MRSHFFILTLLCSVFTAHANQARHTIEKEILHLAKEQGVLEHQIGFVVTPIGSNEPVVSINANKLFLPASIAKLITSWAAIEKWGSAHVFETKIKQYKKSLCIEGGGDPSLVHEKVFNIAEQVSRMIQDPVDVLYVDDSKLPIQRNYAADFTSDNHRSFTAPISALSMNYNSVTVRVQGTTVGKPPKVFVTPDLPMFKVINKAKTSTSNKNPRVEIVEKNKKWEVHVTGSFHQRHNKNYYRSVSHPPLYAGHAFKKYFELLSTKDVKQISHSSCHPDAKTIFTHRSRPLGEMIIFMNKYSTNMIAEMLFAQLGENKGTMEGSDYVSALLSTQLPFANGMIIENGSGLSRRSQVTPLWFTNFMSLIYKDFLFQPEIFASLGISGIDGTLKRRTKHPKLIKNIRGKTGSLSGVTTLAGIMETPYWGKCLFSLFFRHPSIPAWKIFDLEKQLFATLMSRSVLKKNE